AKQADEVIAIQKESLKEKIVTPKRQPWETAPNLGNGQKTPAPGGGQGSEPVTGSNGESEQPAVPGTGKSLASPMQGDDSGTGAPLPAGIPMPELEASKK